MNAVTAISQTTLCFGNQLFGIGAYGARLCFSGYDPLMNVEIPDQIAEKRFALGGGTP
jgi:hypothetical protein